jgi:hypothetical protein
MLCRFKTCHSSRATDYLKNKCVKPKKTSRVSNFGSLKRARAPQFGQLCAIVPLSTVFWVGSRNRNVESQCTHSYSFVALFFKAHGAPQRGHRISTLDIVTTNYQKIVRTNKLCVLVIRSQGSPVLTNKRVLARVSNPHPN